MKRGFILFFLISSVILSAPKTSYDNGVAYALNNYFSGYDKEILKVSKVIPLEENIYAQKIQYKTFSHFGRQIIKEKIFIIKNINSKYVFIEKVNKNNDNISIDY